MFCYILEFHRSGTSPLCPPPFPSTPQYYRVVLWCQTKPGFELVDGRDLPPSARAPPFSEPAKGFNITVGSSPREASTHGTFICRHSFGKVWEAYSKNSVSCENPSGQ